MMSATIAQLRFLLGGGGNGRFDAFIQLGVIFARFTEQLASNPSNVSASAFKRRPSDVYLVRTRLDSVLQRRVSQDVGT
jgi:hypothetical protein